MAPTDISAGKPGSRFGSISGLAAVIIAAAATVFGLHPAEAAFPGNNGRIVYVDNNNIHIAKASGEHERVVAADPSVRESSPAWSADRKWIAYIRKDGELWLYNLETRVGRLLVTVPPASNGEQPYCQSVTWSPTGRQVAYSCSYWMVGGGLYVLDVDQASAQGPPRKIYETRFGPLGHNVAGVAWSPDGSRIAFNGNDADGSRIGVFTIRPNGSGLRAMATTTRSGYFRDHQNPSWSPDGSRIAFACLETYTDSDLCSVDSTGSDLRRLTDDAPPETGIDPVSDFLPAWSPNGELIAFTRKPRYGQSSIYLLSPDGHTRLLRSGGGDPDWETRPRVPGVHDPDRPVFLGEPVFTPAPGQTSEPGGTPAPGSNGSRGSAGRPGPGGSPSNDSNSTPHPPPTPLPAADTSSQADVEPSLAAPGDLVTVSGEGFAPSVDLAFEMSGDGEVRRELRSDVIGGYRLTFTVPDGAKDGLSSIHVTGRSAERGTHDSFGELLIDIASARAAQANAGEGDARDGFPWWLFLILAAFVIVVAVAWLVVRRRPETTA